MITVDIGGKTNPCKITYMCFVFLNHAREKSSETEVHEDPALMMRTSLVPGNVLGILQDGHFGDSLLTSAG